MDGTGEGVKKSSTVSRKVDDLEEAISLKVAAGLCHSLAIIKMDDPKGPKIVEKLPVFDPEEVKDLLTESTPKKPRKKKKSKKKKDEEAGEEDGEEEGEGEEEEEKPK